VSSFDPGWVQTDMGNMAANRTPKVVAVELVDMLEHQLETGLFWHKGQIRNW